MPVDFARVPSKVDVPEPPRLYWPLWLALLVVAMSVGAGIYALFPTSAGSNNGAWFWIRIIAYPVMMWLLFLFCWLGLNYNRRQIAISVNRISDRELRRCHLHASVPLALLGHSWCFSGDEGENGITGFVSGSLKLQTRLSMADSETTVTARWINVPGQTVYGGTEVAEHARHTSTLKWLFSTLLGKLTSVLRELPGAASLQLTLSVDAVIQPAVASEVLRSILDDICPDVDVVIEATSETMSMFLLDSWLDNADAQSVQLLMAVQLRNASSEVLDEGAAEAGVALLFKVPTPSEVPLVSVHRPARGAVDATDETLSVAIGWAGTQMREIATAWERAVSPRIRSAIRSSPQIAATTSRIALDTTVGDCGVATPWLALALAAQHAIDIAQPQLVLVQEGEELIALTCRSRYERT